MNKTPVVDKPYCVFRQKRANDIGVTVYTQKMPYATIDDATSEAVLGTARGVESTLYHVVASPREQEYLIASWKKDTFHSGDSWSDGYISTQDYYCMHDLRKNSIDHVIEGILKKPPVDDATLTKIEFGSCVPYWTTERVLQALAPK